MRNAHYCSDLAAEIRSRELPLVSTSTAALADRPCGVREDNIVRGILVTSKRWRIRRFNFDVLRSSLTTYHVSSGLSPFGQSDAKW